MATVTVTLPAYQNFSLALPQEALLAKFPESILGQALAGDPTATTIVIDNPLVTPNVLQVLHQTLTGQPLQPDSQTDWETVGNYLNLPSLGLLAPASYHYLRTYRPDWDIFRLDEVLTNEYAFYSLMEDLVMANQVDLARKLLATGYRPGEMDHLYTFAAWLGRPEMVTLLQPHVNPREARLNTDNLLVDWDRSKLIRDFVNEHPANLGLYLALLQGHANVVAAILKDPRMVLDTGGLTTLAVQNGDFLSLEQLMANPTLPWADIQTTLSSGGYLTPTSIRLLLNHPETEARGLRFNIQPIEAFDVDVVSDLKSSSDIPVEPPVYLWEGFNVLDAMITHPQNNFNLLLRKYFNVPRILPRKYIEKWVFDPRFVSKFMTLSFYISLVWLWPLDILQRFIQTYPDANTRRWLIDAAEEQYINKNELINFTPNSPEAVRAILPEALASPPQPPVPR